MDILVTFFLNVLFDRGIYPDSWTESIILPLASLIRVTKMIQTTTNKYLCAIPVVSYIVPLLTTGYRSALNKTILRENVKQV